MTKKMETDILHDDDLRERVARECGRVLLSPETARCVLTGWALDLQRAGAERDKAFAVLDLTRDERDEARREAEGVRDRWHAEFCDQYSYDTERTSKMLFGWEHESAGSNFAAHIRAREDAEDAADAAGGAASQPREPHVIGGTAHSDGSLTQVMSDGTRREVPAPVAPPRVDAPNGDNFDYGGALAELLDAPHVADQVPPDAPVTGTNPMPPTGTWPPFPIMVPASVTREEFETLAALYSETAAEVGTRLDALAARVEVLTALTRALADAYLRSSETPGEILLVRNLAERVRTR